MISMVDLSIELASITLKNPLIAASSEFTMTEDGIKSCIDAGAGAVIAKSVNENPKAGQQLSIADYVLLDIDHNVLPWGSYPAGASLFCRSGLASDPLDKWLTMLEKLKAYAESKGSFLFSSITVSTKEGAVFLANELFGVSHGLELNLSTPHGLESRSGAVKLIVDKDTVYDLVRSTRSVCRDKPLIVKLSSLSVDLVDIARHAVRAGADAITLTGRYPGFMPDINTFNPVLNSWGAIGGSWALPLSLYWVSKCYRELYPFDDIVGTNGARTGIDIVRFLLSGAKAVAVATSILVSGPQILAKMIAEIEQYCVDKNFRNIDALIGLSARHAKYYDELAK